MGFLKRLESVERRSCTEEGRVCPEALAEDWVTYEQRNDKKRLHLNDSDLFLFIIFLEVNGLFKAKLIRLYSFYFKFLVVALRLMICMHP